MTLLILYYILYITRRLVWADNMFCVPEQLVDSDVVARERARITWRVSIVTRALAGGAAESETGVGSLSSDFIGNGLKLVVTGMYKECCMFWIWK